MLVTVFSASIFARAMIPDSSHDFLASLEIDCMPAQVGARVRL
jgi:hypothetical protein